MFYSFAKIHIISISSKKNIVKMVDKSSSTTLTDLNIPDFIGENGLFDGHYPMLEIFRAPVFSREFLIQPAFQF